MPETGTAAAAVERLMRSKARTFYLASLFLPGETRRDVRTIYAYYRTVDDLVDEPPEGWDRASILSRLQTWETALITGAGAERELPAGLHQTVERYGIPVWHLTAVIAGARYDLDMRAIETRAELERYAFLMAGSVGLVLAHVLGATTPEALNAAAELGIAMQLTNILRDVGEDLRRGRVYLPSHDLTAAGCGPGDLRRQVMSEGLREVMRDITAEARERYRRGMAGLIYLDASTRFSIYLAARLYSKILDKIEQRDYQVLTERVRLTGPEKWLDTVAGYFQYRRLPAFLESDATEV